MREAALSLAFPLQRTVIHVLIKRFHEDKSASEITVLEDFWEDGVVFALCNNWRYIKTFTCFSIAFEQSRL